MPQLIVLLDVGGVINDKRKQTAEFQQLVGDYFAPLLGGTSQEMCPFVPIGFERTQNP